MKDCSAFGGFPLQRQFLPPPPWKQMLYQQLYLLPNKSVSRHLSVCLCVCVRVCVCVCVCSSLSVGTRCVSGWTINVNSSLYRSTSALLTLTASHSASVYVSLSLSLCLSVCVCVSVSPRRLCNTRRLSVCLLLATLCNNYSTDLHENFRDVSVDKEELVKFWKSSASGSGSRNLLKDSSTLRDRAFVHNLAAVSGKTDWISMKVLLYMCLWTRKSPLNFGSHPAPI